MTRDAAFVRPFTGLCGLVVSDPHLSFATSDRRPHGIVGARALESKVRRARKLIHSTMRSLFCCQRIVMREGAV
jgi:hypothetical protein